MLILTLSQHVHSDVLTCSRLPDLTTVIMSQMLNNIWYKLKSFTERQCADRKKTTKQNKSIAYKTCSNTDTKGIKERNASNSSLVWCLIRSYLNSKAPCSIWGVKKMCFHPVFILWFLLHYLVTTSQIHGFTKPYITFHSCQICWTTSHKMHGFWDQQRFFLTESDWSLWL